MKETYLSRDFRETAAQRFPAQAKQLNAAFDARLNALLAENAGAGKEKQYHLKRQILPGIAAYETLQRVMPKEEALQTVHGYVERLEANWRKLVKPEAQTACRPAAHTGALPPCSRRFCQIHPERFWPGGGLCPKRAADRQRRLAGGYDGVSLSRHLHRIRLPGAVPLLLRQRRHQLYRAASEADLGEKHDAGTRQ